MRAEPKSNEHHGFRSILISVWRLAGYFGEIVIMGLCVDTRTADRTGTMDPAPCGTPGELGKRQLVYLDRVKLSTYLRRLSIFSI